jgi:hypothetical protein
MTRKVILNIFASLLLLPIVACNDGHKQDEQPSQAERERLEKEYQKEMKKLRELTEKGVTDTLNGKKPEQHGVKPTPTPREQQK